MYIKQGFLQPELVTQALDKLSRKIQAVSEEFMKTLESLDALVSSINQSLFVLFLAKEQKKITISMKIFKVII